MFTATDTSKNARFDEAIITPKLSLSVEKAKRLSTRSAEMPTERKFRQFDGF